MRAHACTFGGKRNNVNIHVRRAIHVPSSKFKRIIIMETVPVNKFYGRELLEGAKKKKVESIRSWVKEYRVRPAYILGQRHFWTEFNKQAEALTVAFKASDDSDMVCTFVYQRDNGYRKFVVAHPEMYWEHCMRMPPEMRCSYEIIPEYSPCRLYLDLEYSKELNPNSDGPSMTNTIIDIFCAYFLHHWGLPCNTYNVLNLDSSTSAKFSRHVIFNIKDIAFKDSYHVGRLVKSICKDIMDCVSPKEMRHDALSCFSLGKLEQLFVQTSKDRRLFIDTGVYTKNRHFRVYKSTKWGKQSHLTVSEDCKYIPSSSHKDKDLSIFLSSLVSYFVTRKDSVLLEYSQVNAVAANCFKNVPQRYNYPKANTCKSKYPALDKYIRELISPGKIRLCKYFEATRMLVYETTGYRYCENIGRSHKSNNVFWIVDARGKTLYQKCHDEDCFGFMSVPRRLPEEICFQIDEEGDMVLSSVTVTEDM